MKAGIGTSTALAACISVALTFLAHTCVMTLGVVLLLGGTTTKWGAEYNVLGTAVETALVLFASIWALEYLGRSYCGGSGEVLRAQLVVAGAFSATGLIGYSDTLRCALGWTRASVVFALMAIAACGVFALGITLVGGLQVESVNGRLSILGQCPTPEMLRGYGPPSPFTVHAGHGCRSSPIGRWWVGTAGGSERNIQRPCTAGGCSSVCGGAYRKESQRSQRARL